MQIDTAGRIPVKIWAADLESDALQQARRLTELPFAYHHIALMPDAHSGYGMPIGGVLAAHGAVVPNAVGVDIGCGMCAQRTTLPADDSPVADPALRREILEVLKTAVPLGFSRHEKPQVWEGFSRAPDLPVVEAHLEAARHQLGSLGGGNHFIELQSGSDGYLWLMLHSGSRNFGLQIAREYHRIAGLFCQKEGLALPTPDLAYLPLESDSARDYLCAMAFALEFAAESRFRMLEVFRRILRERFPAIGFGEIINIHHNYAAEEEHYGRRVVVHRKGATSARKGEFGIIPGSQGTRSYIVRGKGNPESFHSCSHGAGRLLGRRRARRELDLQQEMRTLDSQGIVHGLRRREHLDEAVGAYKPIDTVMAAQQDLVRVEVELTPLAVLKGD